MQFIVIGYDHKDEKALERRLAAREEHLEFAGKMFEQGKWIFASALLDDEGNMNGSVIACDFPSEEDLRNEWLDNEAYVKGNVWEEIIIRKAKVAKH
ncbi:MAG: YciI family protein [Bacteroidota bacterium]